jgi:putative transposase
MRRGYKYRIYPNRKQVRLLHKAIGLHRQLYNAALEHRILAWKNHKQSISCYAQANELKEIRKEDVSFAWCNHNALNRTLRRLDKAYQSFFRRCKNGEKPGFPKFKGGEFFSSIEYTYNNGIRLKNGKLYVQEVGLIRIFMHRPIPEDAKIKAATIKFEKPNRWYVVFSLELPSPEISIRNEPRIGIDMGLEYFCALSTGELIKNPRWFGETEKGLGVLQKRKARCKRGSKQHGELSRQITRLHQRTANKRHDFHNQLSTQLVRDFSFIAVENLNIAGLARSHVSKSMGDVGWGQFLHMLEYKSEEHGTRFVKVDARNTSQECSACGRIVQKSLSVREHNCPKYGYVAHRDVNAAQVILQRGTDLLDRQAA